MTSTFDCFDGYCQRFDNDGYCQLNMTVTIMFKSTGGLLIHCLDKGKIISAQTYIENRLKSVSAIEKQQRCQAPKT